MPPTEPDPGAAARGDLARALREMRGALGISGERAAQRALMSQSKISRIETGRLAPTRADVETLLAAYDAPPPAAARIRELAGAAAQEYRSSREDARRGVDRKQSELAAFERAATWTRHFLPVIPTGLLHTRDYARATLADLGTVPAGTLDSVIDARIARQDALADPERRWVFLMTETALRARVAPLGVMAGQCARMAALTALPNVELAVLPFAARWPVMAANTFVVYDDRFVTAELFTGEVLLHDPQDVAYHLGLFEAFYARALTGADAAAFLRAAAAEYAAMARQFIPERE